VRRIILKDRDDFKEMLNQYHVPHGKESDISMTIQLGQKNMSRMVRFKTPIGILIKEQARYVSPYLWATQIIAIIITILLSANLTDSNFEIQKLLFSITPMLTFIAVPELIKSAVCGMSELELTCKNSVSKILATRLFIIGSINLVAITIIITFISIQYNTPFIRIVLYGLVPFNIVNGINLLVFHFAKIRSFAVASSISLCLIVLMKLITEFSFFTDISQTMWIILFVTSTVFLLAEIYYLMKSMTNKEVLIPWN
jgi:hypothetical protein